MAEDILSQEMDLPTLTQNLDVTETFYYSQSYENSILKASGVPLFGASYLFIGRRPPPRMDPKLTIIKWIELTF